MRDKHQKYGFLAEDSPPSIFFHSY